MARGGGCQRPPGQAPPGHLLRDHRGRDPRRVREPARDRPGPRRRPADAADRRPAGRLHAEPAPVAQGPRRPVGRPRAVGRGPHGRRARAGDPRVHGARVLDARGAARDGRRRHVHRGPRPHRRQDGRHRRRRDRRAPCRGHPRPATGRRVDREAAVEAQPGPAVHHQHAPAGGEPQARLQPQADDVDRAAAVRGRRHARRPRRPHHLHADGLDRDRRRSRWPRRRRSSPSRFGEQYGTGKGRVYKTKAKGAQEAHESVRPTSFMRDPDSMRAHLKAEELRLYRLIWQRAIASQMAPKELETTTAELVDGRVPAARLGDPDAVRRVLPGLHRGPGRHRGRGGRAHPPAARRGRGDDRSSRSRRPSTSPSPRRATPRRP